MQVYYNILEMIRTQLLGDANVNTVTTGDIFDVDLDKQTIFPLSHVMVNQATRKDRVYTLNISVLLMDIVDKVNHEATDKFRGNDNEQDVFNTQLSVGGRLVEMLKRGDLRDDNFELTNDPNFEPFTERFENSLAGWALTFDVDVPNTMTVCDVPIVPPSCLAADYSIIDEDGNVLYSGSIASGGSLEQEIQNSTAIVKNSEGTTQSTTSILAEGTETITANDALVGVLNSEGTTVDGDSFASGTTGNLLAPDANYTVQYENGTPIESGSIPSNTSKVIEVPNPDCSELMADMFEGRVLFDSGTFEAKSCLVSDITDNYTEYDNALLVLTPNGYKASEAYSLKPYDGIGDFTVVRNSIATRINESLEIEEVGINVPRVSYPLDGGCPFWLVEPERTNYVVESNDFTTWTILSGTTVTPNAFISPDGTLNASKITGSGTNGLFSTGNATGVVSRSIYLRSVTGSETVKLKDPILTGSILTLNLTEEWERFELVENNGSPTSGIWIDDISASGIYAYGAQLEEGTEATSYVPTSGTAVTREEDVITTTPPVGTTEIVETFSDGSTNTITTIPATYQLPQGEISKIIMT